MEGYQEFIALRRWLFTELEKIDMSNGSKSYEGTFELRITYPSFFENRKGDEPDIFQINFHSYLIGLHSCYQWTGGDLKSLVKECKNDLKIWCDEAEKIEDD